MAYDEDTLIEEIQKRQDEKLSLKQKADDFDSFESNRKHVGLPSRETRNYFTLNFANGKSVEIGSHGLSYGTRRQFPAPNGNVYDFAIQPRSYDYPCARLYIKEYEYTSEGSAKLVRSVYVDFTNEQTSGVGNALLAISEGRMEEET